jgi:hypothetical protein
LGKHENRKEKRQLGKRINWESGNKKAKTYLNTDSQTPGWRTLLNNNGSTSCEACSRRIKVGQKMLWHIETKIKMHKPEDCKLW